MLKYEYLKPGDCPPPSNSTGVLIISPHIVPQTIWPCGAHNATFADLVMVEFGLDVYTIL